MLRSGCQSLCDLVVLRPLDIDDLSFARYVHASAMRALGARLHTPEEVEAFVQTVYSRDYGDKLLRHDVHAAWLDGEMVGTAGWCAATDVSRTARVTDVFVRPMFTGSGVGRLLVGAAERRALNAGLRDFSTRATAGSARFFEQLGYQVSSHGVQRLPSGVDLPVVFMRKRPATAARSPAGVKDTLEADAQLGGAR